ncbi:hypothetical protein EKO04_009983 [Ascochyta lentis]|uniref:Cryptic loci regulator 2 N-terminal domain-containing protein n=1 Tax=Ascochyta lentis TaxID=205686 RepID=A0A8H7IXU5_9PLEO|nr:hypothetical protein EKO04_009983 [Ascochyta lentis]
MTSPRRVVVLSRPGSDGDPTHVPKSGSHTQMDPPVLYMEKLGDQWMQARGEAQPGVKYILEGLPAGYTLWQRPRAKDPKHFDKYLYGHPGQKPFDSPNRFYPHFQHLMDNAGDSMGCPCTVCNGNSGILPRSSPMRSSSGASSSASSRPLSRHGPAARSFTLQTQAQARPASTTLAPALVSQTSPALAAMPPAQHKGRPKLLSAGMDTSHIDEEGTPDVYRNLIHKLRRHKEIDEPIEEPMSLDWRAEQETLPGLLEKLKEQQQWVPRVGDIVLYVRELPDDTHIIRHPITREFRMYDELSKLWLALPLWEAGVVGQTPTEPTTIEDICQNGDKTFNVTYSGIRVEPLPHVSNPDKSMSKRHKYTPIRHSRPLILWKELLHQVPQEQWHPTISNALAVTSNMSLVGKYRFKGAWPDATVYCRGLYLGHEMLAVGDAVRLLPNKNHGQTTCDDILVIKSIRLKWSNLDAASDNDWDEGRPYNSSVWIYGAAYSNSPTRTNKEWLSNDLIRPPKVTNDYGEWFPLHPPSKELAIPCSRVLGRLYEHTAMALWLNTKPTDLPLLDAGREGLLEGRAYSRQHDNRIARELDATWYWGDSRAQALDLHTVNGLDVASHDQERDPKEWRKKIKIMEGMTNNKVGSTAQPSDAPGLAGRNLRGFMAPALSELPVKSQLSRTTDEASVSDSVTGSSTAGEGPLTGMVRKRSHIVNLDSEDDEDEKINEEIRQTMKFVEDSSRSKVKRARVTVVID